MKTHADIKIYGIVQGVGFRPFVHKAVTALSLCGFIRNTSFGAEGEFEGRREDIQKLVSELLYNAPTLAFIESVEVVYSDTLRGYIGFDIAESIKGEKNRTLISPDIAVCDDCLKELFSESDRRYSYPFINCTNCGPRFTIIKDIPYDRKNTTMSAFPMCGECEREYLDISDRRYHAQPDCCENCGPKLSFYDFNKKELPGDAISLAKEYIRDGKIVAVKGLGGIHLACRCDDDTVVDTLRKRKHRDEKPLAIMCRDVEAARRFAHISADEKRHLTSNRRPIVLLKKRESNSLMYLSENGYIGIMLPYTPVHHLLLADGVDSLVMTSANISDLPIIYKDEEVFEKLSGVADGFLMNNREIHARCDDSLMWVLDGNEYFVRRSRGYVPHPVCMSTKLLPILACGAEQKASFALSRDRYVFPSQHIGDLKNLETLENYEAQISHFENIFDVKPQLLACDMHPDYMSTSYADERSQKERLPLIRVQHHHAHMASCMADNGYDGKCIGITWDGMGYGTDGKIWGAEFLVGDFSDFSRYGTIRPIRLPGGDRATHEISRVAASLLYDSGLECDGTVKKLVESGINCPSASSMGRLFDGVASLVGIAQTASYEGQGAALLEAAAADGCEESYTFCIGYDGGMYTFDWRQMIRAIVSDKNSGVDQAVMSARFMNTLISFASEMCEKIAHDTGIKTVALSGGTFQNMYVLKRLRTSLSALGFNVLTHRRVSTNDEGICLGQLMIAQAQTNRR